jgi:hypothetical protein
MQYNNCPRCNGIWERIVPLPKMRCISCPMVYWENVELCILLDPGCIIHWRISSHECEVIHRRYTGFYILPWLSYTTTVDDIEKLLVLL